MSKFLLEELILEKEVIEAIAAGEKVCVYAPRDHMVSHADEISATKLAELLCGSDDWCNRAYIVKEVKANDPAESV